MKYESNDLIYDIIIIGAGPAGIAAAIFASLQSTNILVIEGGVLGGNLNQTEEIENYPAFPKISGKELAKKMKLHLEKKCFNIKKFWIEKLEKRGKYFIAHTEGFEFFSKSIIIATGSRWKQLRINNDQFFQKDFLYGTLKNKKFAKKKEIVVVGGGYAGCQTSIILSKFAKKVYLVHNGNDLIDTNLKSIIFKNEKIEVILESFISEVQGKKKISKCIIESKNGIRKSIKVGKIFPCVGMIPNSDFAKDLSICNERGNIIVDKQYQTKINGIFAAGDIIVKNSWQITNAVSEGTLAAKSAINFLEKYSSTN